MKALAYLRVSTREQADSGLGLEAQRSAIAGYCQAKRLALAREYADPGESTKRPLARRPAGAALLEATAAPSEPTAVVVAKLDRAFRNTVECLSTVDRWAKAGVSLHVIDLGGSALDLSSSIGRMILTIMAGWAEFERSAIGARTSAALKAAQARGSRLGRPPWGYERLPGGTLVPCPEHLRPLALILELHAASKPAREIAKELNRRGIWRYNARYVGDERVLSNPKAWDAQSVNRALARTAADPQLTKECAT